MRTAIQNRQPLPTIEAARRAFASGDVAATELMCAQILAQKPNRWAAWALLTETALQRGRPDAAIVCAERAATLAGNNPIPLILKAKSLFASGRTREALAAAEQAEAVVGSEAEALDALGASSACLDCTSAPSRCFSAPSSSAPACHNTCSISRQVSA